MKSSGPAIDVHRLCRYYGRFVAVHDVSFTVPHGQIVALVGPNGAGKTTLMRMLTGYLAPSAGTASMAGLDIQRDRLACATSIGYLPENGPVYGDMTPREALRFLADMRALPRARWPERIDAAAAQCGIRAILDKPIGKLSKGLRQRVGLAQTLLHDPPILVMDEPTAGLDPIQIREYRAQVRALRQQKTVLVSTHLLQEVDAIADRVLVLNRGRLVFDGAPAELAGGRPLEERFHDLIAEGA